MVRAYEDSKREEIGRLHLHDGNPALAGSAARRQLR
jgi:hypothetical protein